MALGKAPVQSGKTAIRAQIEQNLKRVYETVLEEEVPDRFTELLRKLRAAEEETGA